MRLRELAESIVTDLDLDAQIDTVEQAQERIDSESIHANMNKYSNTMKKLEQDYRALEAIRLVLTNNKKATNDGTHIFLYDVEDGEIVAATWVRVLHGKAEVKWLGSVEPGHGRPLLIKALEQAKQMGATKVVLTSKWESSGFYKKLGFSQTSEPEYNVVGDRLTDFEKEL